MLIHVCKEIKVQFHKIYGLILSSGKYLNGISPDTGQSIKGVADDVKSYSYTYTEPGTYTVTFLAGNGNYQGESGIQTYEMKVTIVDPIE